LGLLDPLDPVQTVLLPAAATRPVRAAGARPDQTGLFAALDRLAALSVAIVHPKAAVVSAAAGTSVHRAGG
jgi:hypothetical protein